MTVLSNAESLPGDEPEVTEGGAAQHGLQTLSGPQVRAASGRRAHAVREDLPVEEVEETGDGAVRATDQESAQGHRLNYRVLGDSRVPQSVARSPNQQLQRLRSVCAQRQQRLM